MSHEMQFDASLGGNQSLPDRINLMGFTCARAKEIQAMKQTLRRATGNKLAFQRLPKHMRRRVMSHNAKRLPRRLREVHLNQLKKSGMPPKQKSPSRKYRRRPHNLLVDYARRQRKHIWLETHIWHAKRFHMIDKWGYRLADRPCDKAFRACYRAGTQHCLVQDLSYFNCIEISGRSNVLIEKFKTICCGALGVGAKVYIKGNREGQTMLVHSDNDKAVGTVYFQWKPVEDDTTDVRVLWLWIHAAYYSEAVDVLVKCFGLNYDENVQVYRNKSVILTELKGNLNRFRLTGPLALAILHNTLKPAIIANTNSNWFENYVKSSEHTKIFTKQCEYWENIKYLASPAELSPHLILSLIVKDPRFNLPKHKTKALVSWNNMGSNSDVPENIAFGPLWDANVRKSVKENKISNAKSCEMKSQLLVPGTELEETGEAIPVILIQRPGIRDNNFLGYGSGWDLIIPSDWGNTFWLSLIMWGGRAGGLREFDSMQFESRQPSFLAPDTEAGKEEERRIKEEHTQRFFRLPPNKRPNYTKLGIVEPFSFNWKILINNWNSKEQSTDNFFVLRDKRLLITIQELFENKTKKSVPALDFSMNCLIPVSLKLEHKGTAKRFARICLPESKDLIGNNNVVESLKYDENQEMRKKMRESHKTLLKRLRRQRIKAKSNEKIKPVDTKMLKIYSEQMKQLWLPEVKQDLQISCSRKIIGMVTSGNFSYTQAHSCAVGYLAMGAIKVLISKPQRNKVLVRDIVSRQYRTANLKIVL